MPIDSIDSSVCTLLSQIVTVLVDQTAEIRITSTPQSEGLCFQIAVHSEDVGKLIGKQGRTARSLRTIFSAVGMKARRRYALDIVQRASLSLLSAETLSSENRGAHHAHDSTAEPGWPK